MEQDNRPLSPHLQVYRMTDFTSAMSVMHRATGIVTAIGLVFVTLWLALTASGPEAWQFANKLFSNPVIILGMFIWSGCLIYHLCNGIRHLSWDAGYNLEIETSRKSARIVVIATAVINVILWIAISMS